jgi:hypothetical protein
MIIGAHSIIYSKDAEADRAFLRDVLRFPHVDVGEGWLIFGLPPGELGVHPHDTNDLHEFYLMCDDVEAFVADMRKRGYECGAVDDQGYGIMTHVKLPGGGELGVYQPRHARPRAMTVRAPAAKPAATAKRKAPAARAAKKPKARATAPRKGKRR